MNPQNIFAQRLGVSQAQPATWSQPGGLAVGAPSATAGVQPLPPQPMPPQIAPGGMGARYASLTGAAPGGWAGRPMPPQAVAGAGVMPSPQAMLPQPQGLASGYAQAMQPQPQRWGAPAQLGIPQNFLRQRLGMY